MYEVTPWTGVWAEEVVAVARAGPGCTGMRQGPEEKHWGPLSCLVLLIQLLF